MMFGEQMVFEENLREVLEQDEGVVYKTYNDHLCNRTCGIGHLVLKTEPEYDWPVGTEISKARVTQLYNQDVDIALKDAKQLHSNFNSLPEPAKIVIASLCFQLGLPRYQKFKLHHAAIRAEDWQEAAKQLRNSNLYRQTKNRTERHCKRLESIGEISK